MRLQHFVRLTTIAIIFFGALLAAASVHAREQAVSSPPHAQTEPTTTPAPSDATPAPTLSSLTEGSDDPWTAPHNLSRSGSVLEIRSVIDSEGIVHTIWTEEGIDTFFYSYSEGNEWTVPIAIEVPFGTRQYYRQLGPTVPTPLFVPELVSDSNGRIYAFWTDETNVLWASNVAAEGFGEFRSWANRRQISEAVISTAVRSDEVGRLHLSYVRNVAGDELPVGVYYHQLDEEGDWSEPFLLYQSSYLRMVSVETINLRVETNNGGESIYVVWDDPALEKVFVNMSRDAGQEWQPVREVDSRQPTDAAQAIGPHGIMLSASGDDVILVWKAAHIGGTCDWFYQFSGDNGLNWSAAAVFEQLGDCSMAAQLFTTSGQPNYLLAAESPAADGDKVHLLQWNGERWSEPQFQETLAHFINANTNQIVNLGCHKVYLDARGTMQIIGCSTGDVRDVWYTRRGIGATSDWYPPPDVWNASSEIATFPSQIDSLKLAADRAGRAHAVWTTADDDEIYYARWAGVWSQGVPVLQSPGQKALDPEVAVSSEGRLFVVWSDSQSGDIYLSTARGDEALAPDNWSAPQLVAAPEAVATSPTIILAPDGVIYVSYIVPYNEGRGIYLVRATGGSSENLLSSGSGNWEAPVLVLDGETMGQAAITNLQSIASADGSLHIQWELHSLARNGVSQALYYLRSLDQGQTWSAPDTVMEGTVSWNALAGGSRGVIFRIWQEAADGGQVTLRYQASLDQGSSWTFPALIAGAQEGPVPAAVALDVDGRAHLLQLNNQLLEHWVSEGELWRGADNFELDDVVANEYSVLAAAVDSENRLFAAYAGRWAQSPQEPATNALRFTSREIPRAESTPAPSESNVSEQPATPATTATATEAAPATATEAAPATAVPSPSPTATPPSATALEQNSGTAATFLSNISDPTLRTLVTLLPAVFIVLIVFGLGIRASRLNRR